MVLADWVRIPPATVVDGTCTVIGIATPHNITDGKSYFLVVSAFAAAHSMGGSFDRISTPDFDCARVWDSVGIDSVPPGGCCCKPSVKTLTRMTRSSLKSEMRSIDERMPRAKVHITQAEHMALREAVLASLGPSATGLSTNEALSATILIALAEVWPTLPQVSSK